MSKLAFLAECLEVILSMQKSPSFSTLRLFIAQKTYYKLGLLPPRSAVRLFETHIYSHFLHHPTFTYHAPGSYVGPSSSF